MPQVQVQASLDPNQVEMQNMQPQVPAQMHVPDQVQSEHVPQTQELPQNSSTNQLSSSQMPFAEVSSLLDPNMKGSKADTKALCEDMKDFAHDYIDYGSMAKQLIPETNTVQHWSKVIETNHLEDMRKCFKDPVNSNAFDNVTHGLGLGMLDVALDTIIMVIEQQIRILSGAAASDPADTGTPMRRIRRRHRNTLANDAQKSHKVSGDAKDQGKIMSKAKGRSRAKKKVRQEVGAAGQVETQAEQCHHGGMEQNVLMVSVGYETVPSGLNA
uniref:Si:ch73-127m5.2 n=1 Tax=Cynoglossus semilaevis TaxID=244447 RepID=A0A3P8W3Z5_CYNSE